jgi:hypothetical protein
MLTILISLNRRHVMNKQCYFTSYKNDDAIQLELVWAREYPCCVDWSFGRNIIRPLELMVGPLTRRKLDPPK